MKENKKRRAGAFFGIHSDFHATADLENIGAMLDAGEVGAFLDAVKPEYWQIDTKGHPGYASYFTRVGTRAPGLVKDWLKIIREETKKRGILLIAHHSALWDDVVAAAHPEWQALNADGSPTGIIDPTSPYADEVFIPMLKELAGEYGLDGVWVDGGVWTLKENYRPEYLARFTRATGYKEINDEASRTAFHEFLVADYLAFVRHYCEEIKKDYPDFEICDNNIYGDYYPGKPLDCIDFLSSDRNIVSQVRNDGRVYARQEKPWDIMYWSGPGAFKSDGGGFFVYSTFHPGSFIMAAAEAISLGGGFQAIFPMTPHADFCFDLTKQYADIGKFMAARREFLYGSRPPQNNIAYLVSECGILHRSVGEINKPLLEAPDSTIFDAIADAGLPVDAELDYRVLSGDADSHPAIIVNNKYFSAELKAALLGYAERGGTLMLFGADACAAFADRTTAKMHFGDCVMNTVVTTTADGYTCYIGFEDKKHATVVFDDPDGEVLICSHTDIPDKISAIRPAAFVKPYSKGRILFCGVDFLTEYQTQQPRGNHHAFPIRAALRKLVFDLGIKPEAYVERIGSGSALPAAVDVVPTVKDGKKLVSVINILCYEMRNNGPVPAVGNITVAIKLAARPKKIMLEPLHRSADFTYDGEYAHVLIPELIDHLAMVIE